MYNTKAMALDENECGCGRAVWNKEERKKKRKKERKGRMEGEKMAMRKFESKKSQPVRRCTCALLREVRFDQFQFNQWVQYGYKGAD